MPAPDNNLDRPIVRGRRAAYAVVEVARLCRLSRARFYDLIAAGAMPPPAYDIRTRRPVYIADIAARCVEVRETNVGIDGRYVLFHETPPSSPSSSTATAQAPAGSRRRPQPPADPLVREMVDALRATGVDAAEDEIVAAITRCCPAGVTDARFDADLLLVRSALRRSSSG